MSALSDYLEAGLLDQIYNGATAIEPVGIYLALYTADPTDADAGTEVSGGSYARVLVNPNGGAAPSFDLAVTDGTGKMVTNADDIVFPTATAPWGTITHFGLRDASTAGALLHHGALTEAQVVGTGGVFKVPAGQLKLRLE